MNKLYILYAILACAIQAATANNLDENCGFAGYDPVYNRELTNYNFRVTNNLNQYVNVVNNNMAYAVQGGTNVCAHRTVVPRPVPSNGSRRGEKAYTRTHDIWNTNNQKICTVTTTWTSYYDQVYPNSISERFQGIDLAIDQPQVLNYLNNIKCRASPNTITNFPPLSPWMSTYKADFIVNVVVDTTDRSSQPDNCLVKNAPNKIDSGTNYEFHVINKLARPLKINEEIVESETYNKQCVYRAVKVRGSNINTHEKITNIHTIEIVSRQGIPTKICTIKVEWQSIFAVADALIPKVQAVADDRKASVNSVEPFVCKITNNVSRHNWGAINRYKNDLSVEVEVSANEF